MEYTDPAFARSLLEEAVAASSKPVLTEDQIVRLMTIAEVDDGSGGVIYTSASLNGAVAAGWRWKAGMLVSQYELGGGPGMNLKRNQQWDQCMKMAQLYTTGEWTVDSLAPNAMTDVEDLPILITGNFLTSAGDEW